MTIIYLSEMSKKWSHLPNAKHIDWVLETLQKESHIWDAADNAVWNAARNARNAAEVDVTKSVAWNVAWDYLGITATVNAPTKNDARRSIAALVAWDDSGKLLDMSIEEVTKLAREGDKAAVLLLPAVIVKNKLKEIQCKWQIEMANNFAKSDMSKEELDTRSYLLGRYDSTNTLTDEEITAVWGSKKYDGEHFIDYIQFARDLLRKAQE